MQGARVSLWVYQFGASGSLPEKYTDSSGKAEFDTDLDTHAEISISVNGTEKVGRSTIKSSYDVGD